ncbi:MAG TPA: regulatory iron-sulfur-containing complex subunit RicT [Bacteroidales bacterium]|nr:regulatory iron-sulfur-containing complex subunit RicT [Bacteroidales bacterium]HPT20432.1 regulatory iron-sulfur-containing complex subunit RicT [Bacteroidales bacterium]
MTDIDDVQGQAGEEIQMPDITYKPGYNKLDSFNWLKDIPENPNENDVVEIRFKNTRKGFFRNINNLRLEIGDVVAVEASPGHDIGRVSMVGHLISEQVKKLKTLPSPDDLKKVYRKAKAADIQKWEEAKKLEIPTMLRSRKIAEELKLNMKIGDVEYQGDKTKAIFYYIADERVDFRQLIKVLADEFKVRIEMRQIGARQEAGRIGGIGSCGRELCCSTYITNFISVTTTYAKYQELSLNPQKLAGQCGKLKCCLNFELDCYVDAQKSFPPRDIPLEALDCTGFFQKMEIHKGVYWYSTDPHSAVNLIALPVERVREIQALNKKGKKVDKLVSVDDSFNPAPVSQDLLKNNSLTRFDPPENKPQQNKKHNKRKNKRFNDKKKK